MATAEPLDGALLDINLAGERCFPIADALVARRVPFAFVTGDEDAGIPPAYRGTPRLAKPFNIKGLLTLVTHSFCSNRAANIEAVAAASCF